MDSIADTKGKFFKKHSRDIVHFSLRTKIAILCSAAWKYLIVIAVINALQAPFAIAQLSWVDSRNCEELNTSSDEFAPSWSRTENILYFNSTRTGQSRFFTAALTSELMFLKTEERSDLNLSRGNQSYIAITGSEAYYSAFHQLPRNSVLNIFKTSLHQGKWSEREFIAELNEDSFTAHPTVSPDGKTMVFSSNREGGEGETDLWMARRMENQKWAEPVNLGTILNSEKNEITPFLANNDTLYFASDGFGGKGGFDIYVSVLDNGEWSAPEPLSELNSGADESDFTVIRKNTAIYASDKAGGKGGLDLYIARYTSQSNMLLKEINDASISVNVSEIIITREVRQTAYIPLIPYVFFKDGSTDLPSSMQAAGRNTTGFLKDEIALQPDSMYAHFLNIIGSRMQQYPEAKLVVEGWSNEGGGRNAALISRGRAESVADFLKDFWGIGENRIIFGFHELPQSSDSKAEGKRVELTSDDERLLAPFSTGQPVTAIQPEFITVQIDARPRNAVLEWKVFKKENDASVLITSGTQDGLPGSLTIPSGSFLKDSVNRSASIVFHVADRVGNILEQSATVRLNNIQVRPATSAQSARKYVLFLLKNEDVFKNGALDGIISSIRSSEIPGNVTIRHFAGGIGSTRASWILKEINERIQGGNAQVKALQTESISGLPTALAPFVPFAVEIVIE